MRKLVKAQNIQTGAGPYAFKPNAKSHTSFRNPIHPHCPHLEEETNILQTNSNVFINSKFHFSTQNSNSKQKKQLESSSSKKILLCLVIFASLCLISAFCLIQMKSTENPWVTKNSIEVQNSQMNFDEAKPKLDKELITSKQIGKEKKRNPYFTMNTEPFSDSVFSQIHKFRQGFEGFSREENKKITELKSEQNEKGKQTQNDLNSQNNLESQSQEKDLENQVNYFIELQYALHPKVKQFEEKKVQPIVNDENSEKDLQKIQGLSDQKTQDSNLIDFEDQTETETEKVEIQSEDSVSESSKGGIQITDQDKFDPIIKVKDQIQKIFNGKFEDLIFIKEGTNITQQQYKNAKDRMNIWKYFNPKTGNLQLIDDVSYDPSVTATQKSTQETLEKVKTIIKEEQEEYEQKYNLSNYQEIPFCIIIPSYNNQDKYFRNLNSILQQDYQNYHIVYIDDASTDQTAQKVKSYIQKYNVSSDRLFFIENQKNTKALPNIDFAARNHCRSGQIMAIIDGDDYLIGTQVFRIINARYQKENLMALYTNHLRVHEPIYLKVGTSLDYPSSVKRTRTYRRFATFPVSHLRTFYVDLYWRIFPQDLKDYKKEYFTAANDFAIMMPILEMAGQQFEYLPQLTYVYDAGTGLNNFKTKSDIQAKNYRITKLRRQYQKLEKSFMRNKRVLKPRVVEQSLSQGLIKSPGLKLREVVEKV